VQLQPYALLKLGKLRDRRGTPDICSRALGAPIERARITLAPEEGGRAVARSRSFSQLPGRRCVRLRTPSGSLEPGAYVARISALDAFGHRVTNERTVRAR